jgi:hypothetical protein
MKQGKTLTELAIEIERRANAKRDLVVPNTKLVVAPAIDADELRLQVIGANGVNAFGMNAHAHGQVAEYTCIPKAYYDRCLAAQPQLLATQVNTWLADKPADRRMVRTLDNKVRAFLSDRYRPLENEDLAEAILPVLLEMDLLIMSTEITERRLYIKAIDRNIERDCPTGRKMGDGSHTFFDTLSPAIIISNSEVGAGRLSVETGVYTRVCTNLAMIGSNFKKQHVGGRNEITEGFEALLSDHTKKLTDAAVWAQVRDVVKGAFDAAKFDAVVAKLAGASEDKINGDVVELVNKFAKRNTIDGETSASILRHLIEGADLSRYGLHSAVTRTAQDVEDYDQATELERLGGNVIELPRQAWQELQQAA